MLLQQSWFHIVPQILFLKKSHIINIYRAWNSRTSVHLHFNDLNIKKEAINRDLITSHHTNSMTPSVSPFLHFFYAKPWTLSAQRCPICVILFIFWMFNCVVLFFFEETVFVPFPKEKSQKSGVRILFELWAQACVGVYTTRQQGVCECVCAWGAA